jgi:inorganic pyrophosphatase
MDEKFWSAVDVLVEAFEIEIDRPKDSQHPHHPSVRYPLDYGYLAGTSSIDRGGIDVWVGRLEQKEVSAIVCTLDLEKSDAEVKLLLGCSDEDITQIMKFHNQGAQSAILIQRYHPKPAE